MKEQGIPNVQIAKILKCDPRTIYNHLQALDTTKQYVRNRSVVFSHLQSRIIQYITDAKLQKANLNQLVWSLGVLYDKERLECGLSTQNIAYADMVKAQRDDEQKLKQLKDIVDKSKV
jgi:hypothetical protein